MTQRDKIALGAVQTLIGRARGAYHNDRLADRAADVEKALSKAFDITVAILSQYPPVEIHESKRAAIVHKLLE